MAKMTLKKWKQIGKICGYDGTKSASVWSEKADKMRKACPYETWKKMAGMFKGAIDSVTRPEGMIPVPGGGFVSEEEFSQAVDEKFKKEPIHGLGVGGQSWEDEIRMVAAEKWGLSPERINVEVSNKDIVDGVLKIDFTIDVKVDYKD